MRSLAKNMPKKMEEALKKQAKKKGLTGERYGAYVYGTMAKAKKKEKMKNRYT